MAVRLDGKRYLGEVGGTKWQSIRVVNVARERWVAQNGTLFGQ